MKDFEDHLGRKIVQKAQVCDEVSDTDEHDVEADPGKETILSSPRHGLCHIAHAIAQCWGSKYWYPHANCWMK